MNIFVKTLVLASLVTSFALTAHAAMDQEEIDSKAQEIASTLQELQAAKGDAKKQILAQACALGSEVAGYSSGDRSKVLAAVRALGVKQNLVALYNKHCRNR